MTGQEEQAYGSRGIGTYPQWWGLPKGSGSSEERVCWVTSNIATDQELKRRGLEPAEIRSGKRPRTMTGREALATIAALT